ncbi:Aspartic proteinase nepenthesin-1 [Dichanthelium oligosanthes]|uniref:Aspartic proteinase nepenthesin-1 n=1 Tax=Dichanthelium oligosanthes TaxID=888268 RepID=A0A1E5W0J4_9POAL|nr:Aspartic proteinase nepenthesin-1 [Dichanthelium oligosanthes]
MANLVLLLVLLVATKSLPVAHCNDDNVGFQLKLTHVDAGTPYTKPQLLSRAIARSKARMAALQAVAAVAAPLVDPITAARVLVMSGTGEYLVGLAIGTPPLYYTAIMDTGSDLIWTQCAPCLLCADQPTPYFDARRSATYRALPCRSPRCAALSYPACFQKVCVYQYYYGDTASTAGVLANETFTFGGAGNSTKVRAPNIAFGCGSINAGDLANSSGMVGFGRGPLSLVSQLGPSRFSYCLTSYLSPTPSRLYFGAFATLNSTNTSSGSPVQSTPFVVNPALPNMYFLSLKGISLGTKRLPIDPLVFAINDDGTGGVIIDSGTSITWLQQDAYDAVRRGLLSAILLPAMNDTDIGLDTCFPWPPPPNLAVTVPDLVLHFDSANMTLPPENYMVIASTTGYLCLAMAPSGVGTIIGNYQQQNLHILYDVANSFLSFVPAACDII